MITEHIFLIENMIFLVFIVSVLLETLAGARTAELLSREEMVKVAGYGEDKLSTVVINGKLICHSGPVDKIPIHVSGATVAVLCGKTNTSWAKGITNSYGEFLIDVPSRLHAVANLEKVCLVGVFHLPKSSPCRRGFTGKHKGIVKLTSMGQGVRAYTTHDIHLMPKPSEEHTERVEKAQEHATFDL